MDKWIKTMAPGRGTTEIKQNRVYEPRANILQQLQTPACIVSTCKCGWVAARLSRCEREGQFNTDCRKSLWGVA